ncbi:MAG TPA: baseplate J/gp47 family protein [Blastocatellia bacterium]|nr:baseplate J/gp47 family protein [Blastocatellia bacterium]
MIPEIENLIERPYQEIVDDILTAIVGGVVNEPIFFDVKEDRYSLAQPASDVRGITGQIVLSEPGGEPKLVHHTFQKSVDFIFSLDDKAVIWQQGATHPEDETIFYVDYFRPIGESRSPLSDINVGSVTRTLGEAIGREIATVYQQINQAYLSGFVDSAHGKALDLVVSILGINRQPKDFAIGLVTFFRDPQAGDGNITIPETIAVATEDGKTFSTTQLRTLQRGQVRIDLPVRATAASKGEAGIVDSGKITTLAQPIAGIAKITNFEPTFLGAEGETDEQLRARAKAALRGLGKATIAALANAIFEGRAKLNEIFDPNSAPGKTSPPGTVTMLVEAKPERFNSLRAAVEQTRAAGVQATLVAKFVFFKPRLVVQPKRQLTGPGKVKLTAEVIEALQKYVNSLNAGEAALGGESKDSEGKPPQASLLKALKDVKDLTQDGAQKPRIVDVTAWTSDIGQPGAASLVDALFNTVTTTGTDEASLRAAFTRVINDAPPLAPTSRRIPDRSLVQSSEPDRAGQPATDTEIEAGKFKVVTPGSDWTVVLDIEPADVVLLPES